MLIINTLYCDYFSSLTNILGQFLNGIAAKETVLPTVKLMSRRAWCRESGPPRSREAFQSNPPATNRRLILKFYLMHLIAPRMRASGKDSVVQFD